jgi:hypothetical protein
MNFLEFNFKKNQKFEEYKEFLGISEIFKNFPGILRVIKKF